MVFCSLDALKKSLRRKNKDKEWNKLVTVERDWDNEMLGFDLGFIGYKNADFDFIFSYYRLFSKSQSSGI